MLLIKDGRINTQKLPLDYLSLCLPAEDEPFRRIVLKILNPIDIILTKIGRLSDEDIVDIKRVVNHYQIPQSALEERFKLYVEGYDGNTRQYEFNFRSLMEMLFE